MSKSILAVENFSAGYAKSLFEPINLCINEGELISLVGPNGTGKSTLLKTFAGLLPPRSGSITLCGTPMEKISKRKLAQTIASVFTQERVPYGMTVREFVALGRIPYTGIFDLRNAKDEAAIDAALLNVHLNDYADRRVFALSDGERSRVFIARAIASEPRVLLFDEPTAFLDVPNILSLFRFLRKMVEEKQIAVLLSTHHVDYALKFSHQLICLDGKGQVLKGSAQMKETLNMLAWAKV